MHVRRQGGFSLVELLVGAAVGLIVVAAAAMVVATHLRETRALSDESRLMQDLRNAADIVGRDLRRAGYWAASASGLRGPNGEAAASNPYALLASDTAASDVIRFRYSRDAVENGVVDSQEQFGFRLRNAAIELQLGDGNWQALTDPTRLAVTAFEVVPHVEETSLERFCAKPCAAGSALCPPRQQVEVVRLEIAGRSATDASVQRSVRSAVRLRNAPVVGACDA